MTIMPAMTQGYMRLPRCARNDIIAMLLNY